MAGPGVGPLIKFNHFRVHIRYDEIAFSADFLYSGKIPFFNASVETADPFLGVYGKLRAAAKKHLIAAHADPVIHDFHIRPGNQFSVSTVNLHPVGVRRIPVPENESGKSITGKRADNLILEIYRSVFHRFSAAAEKGDTVIPEDCGYRITNISDVRDHYAGIIGVLKTMPCDLLIVPSYAGEGDLYESLAAGALSNGCTIIHGKSGMEFEVGGADVEIIGPTRLDYPSENDRSLCFRVGYGENHYLICGDAEQEAERN